MATKNEVKNTKFDDLLAAHTSGVNWGRITAEALFSEKQSLDEQMLILSDGAEPVRDMAHIEAVQAGSYRLSA